jgi:hypothetical protein
MSKILVKAKNIKFYENPSAVLKFLHAGTQNE